jgi:hypothetical protein
MVYKLFFFWKKKFVGPPPPPPHPTYKKLLKTWFSNSKSIFVNLNYIMKYFPYYIMCLLFNVTFAIDLYVW